jgi:hypothetical protein
LEIGGYLRNLIRKTGILEHFVCKFGEKKGHRSDFYIKKHGSGSMAVTPKIKILIQKHPPFPTKNTTKHLKSPPFPIRNHLKTPQNPPKPPKITKIKWQWQHGSYRSGPETALFAIESPTKTTLCVPKYLETSAKVGYLIWQL